MSDALTRGQIEAFMRTLLRQGDLAPTGLWLAARVGDFNCSLYAPADSRAALAAEFRLIADAIENPPQDERF